MNPKLATANLALREGRKADAANLIIEAANLDPAMPATVYATLLNLLLELGRHAEGLIWSEKAIGLAPKDYALLNLRGALLRLSGRRAEAIAVFDRAIKLRPGELAARVNKGHVHNDAGDGAAAEAIFAVLVRQHPRIAELQRALGVALAHQQKHEAAERRFRQVVSLDPRNIDGWLDLSAAALRHGGPSRGLPVFDQAIAAIGTHPRLIRGKAAMLLHSGLRDNAATCLEAIPQDLRELAWFNHDMARALTYSDPERAGQLHRKAIAAAPDNRDYRFAYAEHHFRYPSGPEGSHIDAAYEALKACPLTPNPNPAETAVRAQILARAVDLETLASLGSFEHLGRSWAEAGLHAALLGQLARVETAADRRELVAQHRLWGDGAIARAQGLPINRPHRTGQGTKIRLGFMSSDLREHPVAYFAWPLFEHIDRQRFEIYCYSFYSGDETPLQRKLASLVDGFRWKPGITDHEAAQMIADDDLDMLFELGGSTFMNKLEVMAWKPARLCASWLGYPHSSGLDTIDYQLLDPCLVPPDPDLLIERPLVMPASWIAMSPLAFPTSYRIDPMAPVARNGFVTFGTANNTYKFNAAMLCTWAKVMARVPKSRFIFVRPEVGARVVADNIRAHFAAEGISADRLEFRAVRGAYLHHYNDIDIALDSFPQTGGTTTCEALWMGVPTVTLVGEAQFERLSHSILTNAGLGDLCAQSIDQFVDIATALAEDRPRIEKLRTGLRDRLAASPLGQTEQFARDFYDLIASTVAQHARPAAAS